MSGEYPAKINRAAKELRLPQAVSQDILSCRSEMLLCRGCSSGPLVSWFPGHYPESSCEQRGAEQLLAWRKCVLKQLHKLHGQTFRSP